MATSRSLKPVGKEGSGDDTGRPAISRVASGDREDWAGETAAEESFASMPDTPAYHEHLLDASDVCNSCHRVIRVERIEPTREGLGGEFESVYERRRETTEIGYGPARSASNVKGVFCDRCGTENPYDRIWDDAEEDVSDRRFRELVQATIRTLEHKGVTLARQDFARYALQARRDDKHVDDCLGAATEAAIIAAINRGDYDRDQADSDADHLCEVTA